MREALEAWLERAFRPLLAIGLTLHAMTLFGDLLEPDAALYANVAKHMAQSRDWVNLIAYQVDWLDKPHFPFWMTALSFRLFGVGVVSYRVPGLVFFALGVFYTWRLGRKLHGPGVARLAVLVLLTSQHVVMSNSDMRAEPYLVGLLAAAVYHAICSREGGWGHLVAASAFTAAAVMTKGPFLVFPVACAVVLPALVRKEPLLLGKWVVALALVVLFITPELACLWLQFDAHPEKVVFERTGVSGIRFFLWDSQFGRFTNTGPIRGQGDPSFFFHTVLWAFLPWSLCLYGAAFSGVKAFLKKTPQDAYSWSAAIPMMFVFSASRFQLPHYINILFPFFAVIVAAWFFEFKTTQMVGVVQLVLVCGMLLGVGGLVALFKVPQRFLVVSLLALGSGALFFVFKGLSLGSTIGRSFGAAVLVNAVLLLSFNPELLRYQVGGEAAQLANALPPMKTVMVELNSSSFIFHLKGGPTWWNADDFRHEISKGPVRILVPAARLDEFRSEGFVIRELGRFQYFHVSMPTLTFLNAKTRESVVQQWVLAEAVKQ